MADSKKNPDNPKPGGKSESKLRLAVDIRQDVTAPDSKQSYTNKILLACIAKICKTIGYTTISSRALDLFLDVINNYFRNLCVSLHDYTELFQRTEPGLSEIEMVMRDRNVTVQELIEYVNNIPPIILNFKVPMYPVESKSQLNFLKPGSDEMLIRPIHIHEHLPPMYAEEGSANISGLGQMPALNLQRFPVPSSSPTENEPLEESSNAEESTVRKDRELVSVMMTISGFLSNTREGKLPGSQVPSNILKIYNEDKRSQLVEFQKKCKQQQQQQANTAAVATNQKTVKDEVERLKRRKLWQEQLRKRMYNRRHHHHHHHRHHCRHRKSRLSPKDPLNGNNDESNVSKLPTEPGKQKLDIFKRISKLKESKFDNVAAGEITDSKIEKDHSKNEKNKRRYNNYTSSDEENGNLTAKKNDTLKNVFGACRKNRGGTQNSSDEEPGNLLNAVKLDPVEPNLNKAKTISSIFLKKNQMRYNAAVKRGDDDDESSSDSDYSKIKAKYGGLGIELNRELDYIPSLSSDDDSADDRWSMNKRRKMEELDKNWSATKRTYIKKYKKVFDNEISSSDYDIMYGKSQIIYKSKATGISHVAEMMPKRKRGRPKKSLSVFDKYYGGKTTKAIKKKKLDQDPFKVLKKRGRPRKILPPQSPTEKENAAQDVVNVEENDEFRKIETDDKLEEVPLIGSEETPLIGQNKIKNKRGRPPKIKIESNFDDTAEAVEPADDQEEALHEFSQMSTNTNNFYKPRGRGRPPKYLKKINKLKKRPIQLGGGGAGKKRGRPRKFPLPIPAEFSTRLSDDILLEEEEENEDRDIILDSVGDYEEMSLPQLKAENSDDEDIRNRILNFAGDDEMSPPNLERKNSGVEYDDGDDSENEKSVIKFTQVRPIGPGLIPAFISTGGQFLSSSKLPNFGKLNHPDMPDLPFPPPSMMHHTSSSNQMKSNSSHSTTDHPHSNIQLKPSILNLPVLPLSPVAALSEVLQEESEKIAEKSVGNENNDNDIIFPSKKKLSSDEKKLKKKNHRKKIKKEKRKKDKRNKKREEKRKTKLGTEIISPPPKEPMTTLESSSNFSQEAQNSSTTTELEDGATVDLPKSPKEHAEVPIRMIFKTKASVKYIPSDPIVEAEEEECEGSSANSNKTDSIGDEDSGQQSYSLKTSESVDEKKLTLSISKSKFGMKHVKPKKSEKHKKMKKKTTTSAAVKQEDLAQLPFYFDESGNQVWICPSCKAQDDGTPMIACDKCDAWYHWACVGITATPDADDWYCLNCTKKQ